MGSSQKEDGWEPGNGWPGEAGEGVIREDRSRQGPD